MFALVKGIFFMALFVATSYIVIGWVRPWLNTALRVFLVTTCAAVGMIVIVLCYASLRQIEKMANNPLDLDTLHKLWLKFEFIVLWSRAQSALAYANECVRVLTKTFLHFVPIF